MSHRPFVRTLLTSVALAAAIALAGCNTDGGSPAAKALKPLSPKTVAEIEAKDMAKESPILVRIFKQEAELEVWKQDRSGRFALLKSYPICRWSGELGPKIKEGDRQAPEGFYTITPGQMNPNSQYYLSFNMGYPNAFDRSLGRTGSHLMVHGDCSSRGCYAMTDEQISEIYALGRESFFGGQTAFQVQAYPFKMTPVNMARHRNNPHMPFWKMLKQGYDAFEVTRIEPKVDVCDRRYVFNAQAPANSPFSPAGKCPAYEVPQAIASAVNEKQRRDEIQTAELINRGTSTAPVKMNTDGGMHPVFLSKLRPQVVTDQEGNIRALAAVSAAPGTIPAHTVPPGEAPPDTTNSVAAPARGGYVTASANSKPAPAPTRVATATSGDDRSSGGMFGNLFSSGGSNSGPGMLDKMSRAIGLRSSEAEDAKPMPPARPTATTTTARPHAKPQTASTASAKPQAKPVIEPPPSRTAAVEPPPPPAPPQTMSGAQQIMPTTNFDSRFSGFR